MTKRQEALLARLEAWFNEDERALSQDAATTLMIPTQAVEAIIKIGIHENRLIRVGDRVFTITRLEGLIASLRRQLGEKSFHPRDLRQALGYSRQWTDELASTLEVRGILEKSQSGWVLKQGS